MEEFFAVLGLFATPLAVAFGVAFFMSRAELRRLREERLEQKGLARADRFDRLEQAVDAIAGEVERLAQHQQFTARLLSGREEGARRTPPGAP
jgi:hypothetical protein